jgi:hypothetical protein
LYLSYQRPENTQNPDNFKKADFGNKTLNYIEECVLDFDTLFKLNLVYFPSFRLLLFLDLKKIMKGGLS